MKNLEKAYKDLKRVIANFDIPWENRKSISLELIELKKAIDNVVYSNICPLDHRYRKEELLEYLSDEAYVKALAEVELAIVKGLQRFGKATKENVSELEKAAKEITPKEVYEMEKITRHDINALVRVLCSKVSPDTANKIHPGTTSYDIVDTARALMYKRTTENLLFPAAYDLLSVLVELAEKYAATPQIGRTHGQWTSPVTFGYVIVNYAARLDECISDLNECAKDLEGKISGIVGTYASPQTYLDNEDAREFELYVLEGILGLKQAKATSQIVGREKLMNFGQALVSMSNVLADLSNSMRDLQRSEIAEVGEYYHKEAQVGSSADPNKQNPINFENVQGMHSVICAGTTVLKDSAVSDHQRDLRNSVMIRFEPTHMIAELYLSLDRLIKTMSRLQVHEVNIKKNLEAAQNYSISECLTTILKGHDFPDAHSVVRDLAVEAKSSGKPIIEVAEQNPQVAEILNSLATGEKAPLYDISKYTGLAEKRTLKVVSDLRARRMIIKPS